MSEDTDVMFRIGVMDHPQSKSALESLAKGVEVAQARMTAGVESIGNTASRVTNFVDELTKKLDNMEKRRNEVMRGAVHDSGRPIGDAPKRSMPPIIQSGPPESRQPVSYSYSAVTQAAQAYRGSASISMQPQPYQQQQRSAAPIAISTGPEVPDLSHVMPRTSVRSVMPDEVVRQTKKGADDISAFLDGVQEKLDNWELSQAESLAEMSKDLDGFVAKHGSMTDQIGANLRIAEASVNRYRDQSTKAMIEARTSFLEGGANIAQMVKGVATLGLVSEESAEKFLKSYAVIQGSFEVLSGGARAYNAFARGVVQAREAQQHLQKAVTVSAALETAGMTRLRVYHAALVEEAAAANTAAAANGRLAASRTAAGAAATAAAASSAATGVGNAIGTGAGMLGGMGRVASIAGRATPIGLGITALAAGGTLAYQNATGSSTKSDSSIIGNLQSTNAWLLRLTGQFETLDSPANKLIDSVSGFAEKISSITGSFDLAQIPGASVISTIFDARKLAASQAGAERGQKRLDRDKAQNELTREINMATLEAEREKGRLGFGNFIDATRNRSIAETSRLGFRDLAGDREAERQNAFNRMKMRSVKDEGAIGAYTVLEMSSNAARMRARPSEADSQMKGETQVYARAVSEYAKAKSELHKTLSFAGSTEAQRENALKNATSYHEKMLESLNKQAQLARASGQERLGIEREIQSVALSAIDQQQAKLDALNDRRKSAMRSFVDMDAIERSMATKALDKARAGGGGSLSKMETDLLGRIGTSETERFVDQSTAAKAKKFGFDAFDQSLRVERQQIQGTRQQLEAQLQASFDVSMKVEADTNKVVDAIMPMFDKAIDDMARSIMKSVDEKLTDTQARIQTQRVGDLKRLRD